MILEIKTLFSPVPLKKMFQILFAFSFSDSYVLCLPAVFYKAEHPFKVATSMASRYLDPTSKHDLSYS